MGRRTLSEARYFCIDDMGKFIQVVFITLCFIATLVLDLYWWYQLRASHKDEDNALSSRAPDLVLSAACLVAVLSFVVVLRLFKSFRNMMTQSVFWRAVVTSHTTFAPILLALVWYDTFVNMEALNGVYHARSTGSLENAKLQTAAVVMTLYTCEYVAALVHGSHHKSATVVPYSTPASQPLMYGYDSYVAK